MAEDSVDPLVTPEKSELNGTNIGENSSGDSASLTNGSITPAVQRRASVGSFHTRDLSVTNSIDKSDSSNSSRKKVPHYLRASTGSCHDFCKYGRKHEFEEKARRPIRKRIVKPSPNDYFVEIKVSGGQKKEKTPKQELPKGPDLSPSPDTKSYSAKPKISSDAKTYFPRENGLSSNKTRPQKYKPSPAEDSPSLDPPEIIKREIPLPSEKAEVQAKNDSLAENKLSETVKVDDHQPKKRLSLVKPNPLKLKQASSSDISDVIEGNRRRNSGGENGGKMAVYKASARKLSMPPAVTLASKLPPSKKLPVRTRKTGSLKLSSPTKDRNRSHRIENHTSSSENVVEKTLHVIEVDSEKTVPGCNSNEHVILSLESPVSPGSLSHAEKPSHEADENCSCNEPDELVSDNKKSKEVRKVKPNKPNPSKTAKKTKVVVSEDKRRSPVNLKSRSGKVVDSQSDSALKLKFRSGKVVDPQSDSSSMKPKFRSGKVVDPQSDSSAMKLKFRSGKVVDPQSDNATARRLRFRRGRVLSSGDNKGDLRRNFKKAGSNDDSSGTVIPSEKVVLKHQNVRDKKEAQVLYNNVIEETASKLVESKKSKVKALVGAFETVISLQEAKPPQQAQVSGELLLCVSDRY